MTVKNPLPEWLAAEWHPTKNGDLLSSQVTAGSSKKAWWLGECGHEWDARVTHRNNGSGCPFCKGIKALAGFNDLSSKRPDVAAQWHPTKNTGFSAEQVTEFSNRKAWWLCIQGHEWEATVANRTFKNSECSVCSGKRIQSGTNDFSTILPWLAAQLHPVYNDIEVVQRLGVASEKKLWWICSREHEWEASVNNRAKGSGCPYCSGRNKSVVAKKAKSPLPANLLEEFHPTKNSPTLSIEVNRGSHKNIWWLGDCGHEWEAPVFKRAQRGDGCPFCSGHRVLTGFNDLATTNPKLATEWHSTKNSILDVCAVSAGSNRKAWWLGDCGHEWEASINNRNRGATCPYCANKKVDKTNNLAIVNPALAAEWHPTKNLPLTPNGILFGSHQRIWWQCSLGHEWEAEIDKRKNGRTCPVCLNKKIVEGANDLLFTHPELASEWHSTKNDLLLPTQYSYGSEANVWWQCKEDIEHTWTARIYQRTTAKQGCPQCAARRLNFVSQPEKELFAFLTSLGLQVEQSNRSVLRNIKSREIDLYVSDKKFGIEFNGLYWHSEAQGKGKTYHEAKYLAAKEAGVQLVQVWEDDWRDRKSTVLRALAHKLGMTGELNELYPELAVPTETVYARRTQVRVLAKDEAAVFLEANHIQGFANGSYYLGLVDGYDVLRAVLVLKREAGTEGKTLNIIRYATYGSVVGGFTKLLKHAERTYQPKDFITFADHCVSDGGLYEGNGFVADKVLAPDYMYVVGGERKHKFGYRLKRFQNDPNLLWDAGLTERELAALNGLHRVWDAGKTRYRKTV